MIPITMSPNHDQLTHRQIPFDTQHSYKDCNGNQCQWLHRMFPEDLWSADRLQPGDTELAQAPALGPRDDSGWTMPAARTP